MARGIRCALKPERHHIEQTFVGELVLEEKEIPQRQKKVKELSSHIH